MYGTDYRQTPRYFNQLVLVTLLVMITLFLGSVSVGIYLGEGQPRQIGRYRVSAWSPPEGGVILTTSTCKGNMRHVSMYGFCDPSSWIRHKSMFIYSGYSSPDPNCPPIVL
jgi:hypothetical protein